MERKKKLRMGWIQNLTENEKKIIDDFLEEAAKLKGKALNKKKNKLSNLLLVIKSARLEKSKNQKQKKSKVDMEKKKMKQLIPYQIMRMSKED
jgi:hypothetical protein